MDKKLLRQLWMHISKKKKLYCGLLLILMCITSITEIISIGSVLPFLAALTSPEKIYNNIALKKIWQILNVKSQQELLLPLTAFFALSSISAGFLRVLVLKLSTNIAFIIGSDISSKIYHRTLYQAYSIHISRNTSEIISSLTGKTNGVILGVINPILIFINSIFIIVTMLLAFLYIQTEVTILCFSTISGIYLTITYFSRKQKIKNSKNISIESTNVVKIIQEGLGAIRDILISGNQEIYMEAYKTAEHTLRKAQASNIFVSQCPRYGIETVGMLGIAFIAYSTVNNSLSIIDVIPLLGTLAIAMQRMLPVMQQAYASFSSIQGSHQILEDTINLLNQKIPKENSLANNKPVIFRNEIYLKNISFRYSLTTPWVLRNFSLKIKKGERIGIKGTSGKGKSTLVDILMGLLTPNEGVFLIDGEEITSKNKRGWQKNIAHVPQFIYLSDSSIQENIAFGVPKEDINMQKLLQASRMANIRETIDILKDKYETIVGENGIKLSGGQRQRIGIARALYKDANIIFFDEATSALDNKTENEIMNVIDSLSKELTIVIIAHRNSTLKKCSRIIDLSKI